MRMRLKKNLNERLKQVADLFLDNACAANALEAEKNPKYFDFSSIFKNDNCVDLEIGCGKGGFATEYAKQNPDRNIIAVERLTNVAIVGAEKAKAENLQNVKFLVTNAEFLSCFLKENSIEKIFLNFSCPFPKGAYKNRRLTHEKFLKLYEKILTQDGKVFQKTDNKDFFDFGIESFKQRNWHIIEYTEDLYAACPEDNIQTEYEKKFVALSKPICRLVAQPPVAGHQKNEKIV